MNQDLSWNRRSFLSATAAGLGLSGVLHTLGPLSAADVGLGEGVARFSDELEPLVQFLEKTPRDDLIQQTARRVQAGLSYRELLAALLLAGVRNVQPRPSVGFKFHAVLVVNSAHLASLNSADEDRWLPIFWAIDNFKASQAKDENEGDWTLPPVEEARVPAAHQARKMLRHALDNWDVPAADVAITSLVRNWGANQVFDQLAEYAARDFRSIGHKVIYLSNAQRTLQTIGWEYAEPVMRSLVYAMLNHNGEPNPSTSDLAADRPGRFNSELINTLPKQWKTREASNAATAELVQTLRQCSATEASEAVVDLLNAGVGLQSIWDGIFAASGELLMRKPGIVALHSVTTTNAIRYAFETTRSDSTRKFLLLQNASFLPLFREALGDSAKLAKHHIDELQAEDGDSNLVEVPAIFETMGSDRTAASRQMYSYLAGGGNPQAVVDHARRLVFLKGNDSHDYKFSSAALEDYRVLSPPWRERFLAASAYQLCAQTDPTRALVDRIRTALG